MNTRAGTGYSEKPYSREAGMEAANAAMKQMGMDECDLVMLFSTSKHDPTELRDGVREVVGSRPRLVGGYAAGIITNDRLGYEGHQVGVAVMRSDTMKTDLFIEPSLSDREYDVGVSLGNAIQEGNFDGEPNLLLLYDAIRAFKRDGIWLNLATPLLAGISDALESWPPTAGVGMMGDLQWNPTYQWFDDRIEQHSAMAVVLHGGVKMDTIIMHGCKPSSSYYPITKAEKNTVLEIGGKPAVEMIQELMGSQNGLSWEEYPLFVTLGVNRGEKWGAFREEHYMNRLCMDIDHERKGLVMFEPDLAPGAEVQLMRRSIDFDYVRKRTDELLGTLNGRRPFFALYIDCAGRAAGYCGSDGEEAEEVQKALGPDIPLLGFYSGVEIAEVNGNVEPLDWTGVLCVFSETA